MNILLTSVGRRAYMVKYFKDALGSGGHIHAGNSDDLTVAFQYADKCVITPLIYDEAYIPFLLDYCKENHIDAIISLFDIDLLVLAKNKDRFAQIGTRVVVSHVQLIEICNDKWKTFLYLRERGFRVPKTYPNLSKALLAIEEGELSYPVVVKPRFGSGSIAMSVAEDEMALLYYYSRNTRAVNNTYLKYESAAVDDKILFQEYLDGQEYGADIINDLNGQVRSVIAKKKLVMRAGETDIAEVVEDKTITAELTRLGQHTRHIGNMDCDLFMVDGVPYILEMNARFGGGYPFSHMAGCNLPRAIISWLGGKDVPDRTLEIKKPMKAYKEIIISVAKDRKAEK